MDHIPEGELAIFAFSPDAVSAQRREEIQRHIAACAGCRATSDFFAVAEDDLADIDVWEPSVGSATRDALFAYAARIAAEDREADELLKPLFENPGKAAWQNITTQKRFLTGGVVRRLCTHAHNVFENDPLDALTFADAAISVAEALPEDTYPANAVYELRGTAWKERANALRLLGDFGEALPSLARAERAYRHLVSPGLGLSSVAYVRATVLYEQQRLEEAAVMAEQAERGFAHLGDEERRMNALYLRACIKLEAQDLDNAVTLYQQVLDHGEAMNNPDWIARSSYALGNCEVDRGNLGEASMHFHKALVLFRDAGASAHRVRTEWGIARALLHGGKRSEAIRRLGDVVAEFEQRGMVTDAALAGLDIADALLALGQTKPIVDLATRLFRVFTEAGMLTGALTAIAYIKEAAAAGTLTPAVLQSVRNFLPRAERQPNLLFEPPPDTFR